MLDASEKIPVLITVQLEDEILNAFRDVSDRLEILVYPVQEPRDIPEDVWSRVMVLYTLDVVPEPAQAPRLRWVHAHSAGVEHLLTQSLLQTEGVLLTSSSGIHATNMAEYAFMMMLAFGHRLLTMMEYKDNATWPTEHKGRIFMPQPLRGSAVGIVGYGSIGREIAHIAHTFGMEVLAVKRDVRRPADFDSYNLPGAGDPEGVYFHRLYPPEALISMVKECDFVVLTVPLTESTRAMIGADVFEAMKSSAYLINISRGGVVHEEALLHALQTGQIAGAALDVFEAEPLPADSPLWKLPNLIISPHIAGNTPDYNQKAADLFVENLQRYLARKDLLNLVDRTQGY